MKAAMQGRPYLLNAEPLSPGYWKEFFSASNNEWTPPEVTIERLSGRLGDVLGWIGGVPLFSSAAVQLLTEVSAGTTQFLPFGKIKGRTYSVIWRVPVVSDLSGESVANAPAIFCLAGDELRKVLVKEAVPELVVAKRLTGFEFRSPEESHLRALFKGESVNAFPGVRS